MRDEELLRFLGVPDDHVKLTLLVRLERPGSEAIIGTLAGPNAWLQTWPPDDHVYAAVQADAMIGLLAPAARVVARAAGHECHVPRPERWPEADDLIAAWIEVNDTEIDGELFAARDVMLALMTLSRPFEPRRTWGTAGGWQLVTEMVAINPD